jgi:RES domain-containing protein
MTHVKAFRIVKAKWAATAFDGEGARLFGGRWNSKGIACVYLAESESLAALEILVHINSASLLAAYTSFEVSISSGQILKVAPADLPANWQENPAPSETAEFGDDWLRSGDSVALWVPSTIITRERNILLNPRHPEYDGLVEAAQELPFQFDPRLK